MLNTAFSPWPKYTEEEAEAVKKILLSNKVNYWTGNETRTFEKEFAAWAEVDYAIALANGTVALEAALKAIGLEAGDEVIVTSRTFIASVSSIVLAGGKPVFADVDEDSQNITPETILAVLTARTKAILCVHLAGWPCDMDPIMDLAREHNLYVIEDCAQAHGAKYKGKPVGSLGHLAAWSFCQDKIMTTGGEGGMVTTNDQRLWSFIWSYKDHGKSWEAISRAGSQSPFSFKWVHEGFGTNARMSEIQAILGRLQLQKMNSWHQQRLENAMQIWAAAARLPGLRVGKLPKEIEHAAYKCYVFVVEKQLAIGWDRDRIMESINKQGVPCFYGSCSEVYLEQALVETNFRPKERLAVARRLGETSLMFLVHPTLTCLEIEKSCQVLEDVLLRRTYENEQPMMLT